MKIRVTATNEVDLVVAQLEISQLRSSTDGTTETYRIVAAVAEPEHTRYTSRTFTHRQFRDNYLGLIESALIALDDDSKEFLDGPLSPPDLARRLYRSLPEIQAWSSELRGD